MSDQKLIPGDMISKEAAESMDELELFLYNLATVTYGKDLYALTRSEQTGLAALLPLATRIPPDTVARLARIGAAQSGYDITEDRFGSLFLAAAAKALVEEDMPEAERLPWHCLQFVFRK